MKKNSSHQKEEDVSSRIVHPPGGGAPYRRGYDPTLFYIDGREYSFEEVRGAARLSGHLVDQQGGLHNDDVVIINTNARLKALERERHKALHRTATNSNSNSNGRVIKQREDEQLRKQRETEERRRVMEEKLRLVEEEERSLALLKQGVGASPLGGAISASSVSSTSSLQSNNNNNKRRRDTEDGGQQGDQPAAVSTLATSSAPVQKKITAFLTPTKEDQPAKKSRTSPTSTANAVNSMGSVKEAEDKPSATRRATTTQQQQQQHVLSSRSPTLTVHTKTALAKLLPMFREGAGCGHTTTSSSNARVGSTTPTMTINTRSAHAAVSSMFSAPLSFGNDEEAEDEEDAGHTLTNDAEEASPVLRGERENVGPGGKQQASSMHGGQERKRGPLAVYQAEKRITFGDVLKKELGHSVSPHDRGGKKTNADAIREVLEEENDTEYTQDYLDTASLPQLTKRRASGVGFQIYEDLELGAPSPPQPRKLQMASSGNSGKDDGERDESFLAALDETQYDPDQSAVFGSRSTPMKSAAMGVFEDVDSGGNRTRDMSLSNIRCFVDMDGGNDTTSSIKIRPITGEDGDMTRGGNTTSYYSGNNTTSTSSFSGFSPTPSRSAASGNPSVRRSSRRNSNADQTPGVTPLTYRKGCESNAMPQRTPFAPKNENVPKASPAKTPSPSRKDARQLQVVDPFSSGQLARQLAALDEQLRNYLGYIECSDAKAPGAKILKVPKGRRVSVGGLDPSLQLRDCPPLEVERRIGEGAFATVFLVERTDIDPMYSRPLALKAQEPPSVWEWYINHEIQQRVPQEMLHSFIKLHSIHMYKDKSLILMDYYQYSLQDVISLHRVSGKPMDEVMVIYYTIEMMKVLETLHKTGIIHGDVKPDNWLIRNDPCEVWDNWGTGTAGGWDTKGLILIDYGRGIDTTLYPPGTRFTSDIGADSFRCPEMRDGMAWTYQADLFAFLGVVHCMLHNNYMDTLQYKEGNKIRWKPRENFKRYWQSDVLWRPLFDTLLNIEDCDHIPTLRPFIATFEEYLIASRKSLSVRTLLSKQGIMMHEAQGANN